MYKDVVPEYSDHLVQLCSGLSVGMELRAENAVETFRQTVGPWDVQMAKELRPASLRASAAISRVLLADGPAARRMRKRVCCAELAGPHWSKATAVALRPGPCRVRAVNVLR